jgi:hypothetical protein
MMDMENKCIICGKSYSKNYLCCTSENVEFNIDKRECYLVYKKLMGIYGIAHLQFLSKF